MQCCRKGKVSLKGNKNTTMKIKNKTNSALKNAEIIEYQNAIKDVKKTQSELEHIIQELKEKKAEYNRLISEAKELKQKLDAEYRNTFK